MNTNPLNRRPRLAIALQLALLVMVFQGVVATSPTVPVGDNPTTVTWSGYVPPAQP